MATVKEMLKEIYLMPELKLVEKKLEDTVSSPSPLMEELSGYMLKGGKRLRPLLVILSASFYPHSTLSVINTACAAELIHTASLVHDDIIDSSPKRRGRATLNSRFGCHMAVLAGDFLFARAFELLTRCGEYRILELMTQNISLMCEGEVEQARKAWDPCKTEQDYMEQVYKKTSFFISCCCRVGGLLSSMPPEQLENLSDYGLHLGYAYQMTDDILDFSATPITGKPVGSDLAQGNLNYPLLFLMGHPNYGAEIKKIIEEKDCRPETLKRVQKYVEDSGALQYTYLKAREQVSLAKKCLQHLPPSQSKPILYKLAEHMLTRQK
ncbi:polyprenyl synthetase family protein [Candidatus Contubernalis alkaliaceticus]|uniref:polyprenyl synthetase family protein n=1 Tax=Candidatus Contubernalis alkaliaceticus TaxID=338645 RepID=UPI001F4C1BC1|nr:polyprenyl synthetase family protein [Candidatus Contubernalis alkalaceticus]UNC93444.1 polyprenyl synthetase family protein [Candidatus Contubernalis alkalaceticus]